jgi:uncharacterized lipoprotein NlpE involved in copper resistance
MKNVLLSAVISAFAFVGCNNPSDKPTAAAATTPAPVETAKPMETPPAAEAAKPAAATKPAAAATSNTVASLAPGALFGMKVGMSIPDAQKIFPLRKAKEENGEGTFTVYKSAQEESSPDDMIIYIDKKGGKEVIRSMQFTGNEATKEGIKVGSTLADLRKAYPKLIAHGSEIESRVTAEGGGYSFLLNTSSTKYDLDQATLKATVKVKAILF